MTPGPIPNWGTSFFKNLWPVFIASEWSITETGEDVQVSYGGCINPFHKTYDGRQDEKLDIRMFKTIQQ